MGNQEALSIVHKILKKASGGHAISKPSAFVVSAVKAAWRLVRDGAHEGWTGGTGKPYRDDAL